MQGESKMTVGRVLRAVEGIDRPPSHTLTITAKKNKKSFPSHFLRSSSQGVLIGNHKAHTPIRPRVITEEELARYRQLRLSAQGDLLDMLEESVRRARGIEPHFEQLSQYNRLPTFKPAQRYTHVPTIPGEISPDTLRVIEFIWMVYGIDAGRDMGEYVLHSEWTDGLVRAIGEYVHGVVRMIQEYAICGGNREEEYRRELIKNSPSRHSSTHTLATIPNPSIPPNIRDTPSHPEDFIEHFDGKYYSIVQSGGEDMKGSTRTGERRGMVKTPSESIVPTANQIRFARDIIRGDNRGKKEGKEGGKKGMGGIGDGVNRRSLDLGAVGKESVYEEVLRQKMPSRSVTKESVHSGSEHRGSRAQSRASRKSRADSQYASRIDDISQTDLNQVTIAPLHSLTSSAQKPTSLSKPLYKQPTLPKSTSANNIMASIPSKSSLTSSNPQDYHPHPFIPTPTNPLASVDNINILPYCIDDNNDGGSRGGGKGSVRDEVKYRSYECSDREKNIKTDEIYASITKSSAQVNAVLSRSQEIKARVARAIGDWKSQKASLMKEQDEEEEHYERFGSNKSSAKAAPSRKDSVRKSKPTPILTTDLIPNHSKPKLDPSLHSHQSSAHKSPPQHPDPYTSSPMRTEDIRILGTQNSQIDNVDGGSGIADGGREGKKGGDRLMGIQEYVRPEMMVHHYKKAPSTSSKSSKENHSIKPTPSQNSSKNQAPTKKPIKTTNLRSKPQLLPGIAHTGKDNNASYADISMRRSSSFIKDKSISEDVKTAKKG